MHADFLYPQQQTADMTAAYSIVAKKGPLSSSYLTMPFLRVFMYNIIECYFIENLF